MSRDSVYMIGAGDHAKVVMTTLEACKIRCAGIYDDDENLWGKELWCVPILGPTSDMPDEPGNMAVIAIGSNRVRREISKKFSNICWPVIVHPLTDVHSSVRLGYGTIVFAGTIIQADTTVGNHSIVNASVLIDHDCTIGDYCHILPRACIADGVSVGDGSFIGMGAVVIPHTHISTNVTVGAGSTVIRDLDPDGTFVGTPARRILRSVISEGEWRS
ncbi:MAG: acetyltransferase [Synergistaceae bacterium]|nr:acetyltransferase [Synergistaceae bacterium]